MAAFLWTYASWDKIRPTLLPSTGLGKLLKEYEKQKAELEQLRIYDFTDYFQDSMKALEKVDKARKEAIASCGKNPLFKSAKKALEDADVELEKTGLKHLVHQTLVEGLEKVSKPITQEVVAYKPRVTNAQETLENLKKVLKQIDNLDFESARMKVNDALSKDQLKLAKSAANGENNYKPGQTCSDSMNTAMAIRKKGSVLKAIAPKAIVKWEQLFTIIDKFGEMQSELQMASREIGTLYTPYADE